MAKDRAWVLFGHATVLLIAALTAICTNTMGQNVGRPVPRVVLDQRPDCPLLMSAFEIQQPSVGAVDLRVGLVNTSKEPITAYTVGFCVLFRPIEDSVAFRAPPAVRALSTAESDSGFTNRAIKPLRG